MFWWIVGLGVLWLLWIGYRRQSANVHPPHSHEVAEPTRIEAPVRPRSFKHPPPPLDESARFRMTYADVDGVITDRTIQVVDFNHIYLQAYCELRGDYRTFAVDGILNFAPAAGGQDIPDPVVHLATVTFPPVVPGKDFRSVMTRAKLGLTVLAWIALGDRRLSEREIELLLSYVDERATINTNRLIDPDWNRSLARERIAEMAPSYTEAIGALARIRAGSPEREIVRRTADRIITSDGAPEPKAAARMAKIFNEHGYGDGH